MPFSLRKKFNFNLKKKPSFTRFSHLLQVRDSRGWANLVKLITIQFVIFLLVLLYNCSIPISDWSGSLSVKQIVDISQSSLRDNDSAYLIFLYVNWRLNYKSVVYRLTRIDAPLIPACTAVTALKGLVTSAATRVHNKEPQKYMVVIRHRESRTIVQYYYNISFFYSVTRRRGYIRECGWTLGGYLFRSHHTRRQRIPTCTLAIVIRECDT